MEEKDDWCAHYKKNKKKIRRRRRRRRRRRYSLHDLPYETKKQDSCVWFFAL